MRNEDGTLSKTAKQADREAQVYLERIFNKYVDKLSIDDIHVVCSNALHVQSFINHAKYYGDLKNESETSES